MYLIKIPDVLLRLKKKNNLFFAGHHVPLTSFKKKKGGGKSISSLTGGSTTPICISLYVEGTVNMCVCTSLLSYTAPPIEIQFGEMDLIPSLSLLPCRRYLRTFKTHIFVFLISCHQWGKHSSRAGNGILAVTNSKSRPALQSVFPDWIL